MSAPTPPTDDYWVCACVKRNRRGQMTAIKTHPPSVKRCSKCACTPAGYEPTAADLERRERDYRASVIRRSGGKG